MSVNELSKMDKVVAGQITRLTHKAIQYNQNLDFIIFLEINLVKVNRIQFLTLFSRYIIVCLNYLF